MKISIRDLVAVLAVLLLVLSASCYATELVVSAAASLTNAFTDIGHEFESAHAETKVLFNFAGSGQLLQQIAKGAPVDVFASADQETMDKAEAQGLIEAGTRADFARNSLVVVVPANSSLAVASLNDLAKSEIRHVAIGNPDSVPVGRYSKAALQASGVWGALQGKIVNTQNVRQSLHYVARGEVEAAFVYRTDAAILTDKVKIALDVPTDKPILYPVAATRISRDTTGARDFIAFVRSNAGKKILQKYGFGKP